MNWSYATISFPNGHEFIKLNRELERRFHVKDPKSLDNEIMCDKPNLKNHVFCLIQSFP